MKTLRSISIGFAIAAVFCFSSALFKGAAGTFDGGDAAMFICGCFIGGFALAGILLTGGRRG